MTEGQEQGKIAQPKLPLPGTAPRMADPRRQPPWLVRISYRMRVLSFGMAFVAAALHSHQKSYLTGIWVLLGLVFLVYPQVQY